MTSMWRSVLGGLAIALLTTTPSAAQEAPAPGTELVEICAGSGVIDIPEIGPRTCATFEAGSVLFASICGQLPIPAEACANLSDGRVIDTSVIDDYQRSWAHRALRLQEHLDRDEPMRNSLIPHTHNSSNSSAYAPSVSNLDPNQRFTITDQLRMDIRGIELDLHWVPSASGSVETGGYGVVMCHGTTVDAEVATIHLGCSVDQPFRNGLVEIREFLGTEGNEEVVVLLYLENQLDGDLQAHELASDTIESVLGDLVLRPPSGHGDGTCAEAPMDRSRQDVLDAGHQVVIVGNCGPGAWGTWVHERGPLWQESSHDGSYPSECDALRAEEGYDENFIRHWEDLTWLTATASGATHRLTPEVTAAMVRCGVDMVGFDELGPDDGRLEALVWSWAPDEPIVDPDRACAARDEDGRFHMSDCTAVRAFACELPDGTWTVPDRRGEWFEGDEACQSAGAEFAVPATGWENVLLGRAGGEVDDGVWIPIGLSDIADVIDIETEPVGTTGPPSVIADESTPLPATGGATPATWVLGAVLVGLLCRATRRAGMA